MYWLKVLSATSLCSLTAFALAGTLSVTSPNDDDFLGRTNQVGVNITGASRDVTVKVEARGAESSNSTVRVTVEKKFTPNTDGKASGNLDLNFSENTPQGKYNLRVSGTEQGATYNTVTIPVTVDVKAPKFLNFNPGDSAFVSGGTSGIVRIRCSVEEPNVKEARVQIDSADIPNNTSSDESFVVNWDTRGIPSDGPHIVNLRVEDLAKNSSTRNVSITLDRLKPNSTITSPVPGVPIRPGTNIPVSVEIADQFASSLHFTGIDVVARTLDGKFLGRVARRGAAGSNNTLVWTGRLRYRSSLPSQFKIVVSAVDKAGNRAVVQEARVTLRR